MRASAGQPRARLKDRTARRPAVASFGGAAAGFLTLPKLSNDIPTMSVSKEDDKRWLKFAELCAELVSDDELDITNKTTARDIVSQALSMWATKLCADINLLDSFSLAASLDRDSFYLDYQGEETEEQKVFIGFVSNQMTPYINVGNKIEMLEKAHPGLGRTAVHAAEQAGWKTFGMFSPNFAFAQASYMYWMGMDNDEDVKSERECYGEDEGGDEEILFPSKFLAAFPELYFSGDCLERDALQSIASGEDAAAKTAQVIISIMDLVDQGAALPGLDSYCIEQAYFSCYMGTGTEHNAFDQVLDDFYQQLSYGGDGYTDVYGVAEINFDRESFRKWREETEKGFQLYSKLDRLMGLIGEKKLN